ncbi:methyl-accepting chemotaxis protein [Paraburkholderia silvatlantica]|uniref:Methyl-accepting chemotaxis protein n=1 Tax=Paraburkholderia silvatlantica TaxID=321895 RepID=A0ABR6FGF7_9BURK|nr:methyl-accepting chemotaxis protein [Paraburkholderia silvatlantica]MBB2926494.1 methyl-accepting chemotaxis protein [Paraburkholderia silvatlantica]PVY25089.1 methyl-accepting chemotaxis protein [Paraburkholderia silvatlantica]PXW30173.1 methyl-accepting chemotaxis protein [Paraburkholderia silvatlantica]
MSFLTRIKIGPRLGAGFAIVLLLLGAVGGIGLLQASRIFAGTEEIGTNWLPSVETLGNMRNQVQDVRRTSLRMLIASDASEKASLHDLHSRMVGQFGTTFDSYSKLVSSAEERRMADSIGAAWSQYLDDDKKIEALVMSADGGSPDARAAVSSASAKSFTAMMDLINQDVTLNHNGSTAEVATAKAAYHGAVAWTIALIVIAIGLGATIALFITRSITGPIARAVDVAETVARGDLTARIDVQGTDEAAQLLGALRHMNERLVDLVGRVRTGSEGIATAAAQIAAGNTDLSQRTEEQAASLEETAASMEELTATVKQNADNATQGNTLAGQASQTATRGGEVVGRVVDTMRDIANSSEQVAQIISVIEGIAFQTNILALNAAVEAARAGEQGRGFAVVAGEVRTLAQRSATAAREIKELIGVSVERVNNGTALVDDAGRTMGEIVQSVKRVADLMNEISAASGEQRTGIEQVNQAVTQMDEVTQQNAALVEEASAAAQSMSSQAAALRELVSVFNIGSAGRAATANVAPAAKAVASATVRRRAPSRPAPVRAAVAPAPKADRREPATATSDDDWQTF